MRSGSSNVAHPIFQSVVKKWVCILGEWAHRPKCISRSYADMPPMPPVCRLKRFYKKGQRG